MDIFYFILIVMGFALIGYNSTVDSILLYETAYEKAVALLTKMILITTNMDNRYFFDFIFNSPFHFHVLFFHCCYMNN